MICCTGYNIMWNVYIPHDRLKSVRDFRIEDLDFLEELQKTIKQIIIDYIGNGFYFFKEKLKKKFIRLFWRLFPDIEKLFEQNFNYIFSLMLRNKTIVFTKTVKLDKTPILEFNVKFKQLSNDTNSLEPVLTWNLHPLHRIIGNLKIGYDYSKEYETIFVNRTQIYSIEYETCPSISSLIESISVGYNNNLIGNIQWQLRMQNYNNMKGGGIEELLKDGERIVFGMKNNSKDFKTKGVYTLYLWNGTEIKSVKVNKKIWNNKKKDSLYLLSILRNSTFEPIYGNELEGEYFVTMSGGYFGELTYTQGGIISFDDLYKSTDIRAIYCLTFNSLDLWKKNRFMLSLPKFVPIKKLINKILPLFEFNDGNTVIKFLKKYKDNKGKNIGYICNSFLVVPNRESAEIGLSYINSAEIGLSNINEKKFNELLKFLVWPIPSDLLDNLKKEGEEFLDIDIDIFNFIPISPLTALYNIEFLLYDYPEITKALFKAVEGDIKKWINKFIKGELLIVMHSVPLLFNTPWLHIHITSRNYKSNRISLDFLSNKDITFRVCKLLLSTKKKFPDCYNLEIMSTFKCPDLFMN